MGSPTYFREHPRPRTPEDLTRHNCLTGSTDYWTFDIGGQHRHVRVSGNWRGNSGLALVDAVRKGLGLAQLPDYYVRDALAAGELVSVLDDDACSHTAVWVVYPRHRHLSPKVRQFVDFLVQHLGHNGDTDAEEPTRAEEPA